MPPPPGPGEVLFARYAYPPNRLGCCGPGAGAPRPEDTGGAPEMAIRDRIRSFDAAWAYLETIAGSAGLDPLDPRVVEAYWVGNELLDLVDPVVFAKEIRTRFAAEAGANWAVLDDPVATPVAHHSFQVLTVDPWVRLLGRGSTPLKMIDRCRVRHGEVVSVIGPDAVVRTRPLSWDGHTLSLGAPREERARWAQDGRSLLGTVSPGEVVALHWDWVCDRLTSAQARALADRTQAQLELTNSARRAHRVPAR